MRKPTARPNRVVPDMDFDATTTTIKENYAPTILRLDQKIDAFRRRNPEMTGLESDAALVAQTPELSVIPVSIFREQHRPAISVAALQEWEGLVTGIEGERVYAVLIDKTAEEKEWSETAEFGVGDVSPADRNRVAVGAVFRWIVGYVRDSSGTRTKDSRFYFLRSSARFEAQKKKTVRIRME